MNPSVSKKMGFQRAIGPFGRVWDSVPASFPITALACLKNLDHLSRFRANKRSKPRKPLGARTQIM